MNNTARFVKLLILMVAASCLVLGGCTPGLFGKSARYQKGASVVFEGKVDNVVRNEIIYDRKLLSITSIGFTNGSGVNLVGMHPGITNGKTVRISADFFDNVYGSDIFTVAKIGLLQD